MTQELAPNQSPLDQAEISKFVSRLVRAGETNTSIARQVTRGFGVETTADSVRRFRKRHSLTIPGTEPAYTKVHGDEAECLSKPTSHIQDDPDRMLKERGLDPADWYIDTITANEWEGLQKGGLNKSKLYQTKFTAKRKRPYVGLMPARSDGWKAPDHSKVMRYQRDHELIVICGDQQAPFHDTKLHNLFCDFLNEHQPDRGVVLGDLGDYPEISRHPMDPENNAKVQECLQGSYDILRDYVYSSPATDWDFLIGNHDERIRQYLLKNAPKLWPINQVDTNEGDGENVLGLSHLLRLDELKVNFVEPNGTYEDAQVTLSDNLAVRHGWVARKGSGSSALATLEQTGYSVIVGHTHRQSCVYHTYHEIDRKARQLMAVEAGCMCRIDGRADDSGRRFPNFTVHPDWQQGFCTATVYPDGKFSVDLARYVNGVLLYRDRRYE